MTAADLLIRPDAGQESGPQRFIFRDVDWAFYENVGDKLSDRRVFVTFYKGKLEVVTVSLLHERICALLVIIVRVMAEEASMAIQGAGMATLKRMDLDDGVEPDSSFYIAHERQMRGKTELDLTVDPPPDLAIEVEVTRRLGARKAIYRELGVPEVWVYNETGLTVLIKQDQGYAAVDRSPTFPLLSPREIADFVAEGLAQDETSFAKAFRRRVQEIIAGA
jgi:Uma2 family endonuclease